MPEFMIFITIDACIYLYYRDHHAEMDGTNILRYDFRCHPVKLPTQVNSLPPPSASFCTPPMLNYGLYEQGNLK